ncbi:hypothetical protein L2735_15050 [Shewanella olleyana]|uniref:hypothetical protein n=1 Tax=Shewanella olleyana TaxID=135626 RepID=UPI002010B960|nr:hypothetical protein [Shewanella olleyana]MCL1068105.1 hypothetical protein [Shewanella olleyana]
MSNSSTRLFMDVFVDRCATECAARSSARSAAILTKNNKRLIKQASLMTLILLPFAGFNSVSAEKANTSNQPVLIESKVTGTQEQPKVLYIMPWQGITNPIAIQDKNMQITLPEFRPINPKHFQKEVREFSAAQGVKQ